MSSHIDEKRYSVLVDYLTSCKEGDLRDSRVYPVGATANEKRRIRQQAAMFVLKERLLYYRATDTVNEICLKRVIANVKERTKIIRACHDGVDGCHYGRDKTRAKIGQTYWWKGLNRDVDQYCRRCDVCQRVNAKLEGKKAELHPIPVPSKVWSQIGIDLIGPLPETCRKNKYIVTVTDYFSKWPEGAPLKDKTAVGVADFLFTVFCRHGWPDIIISDQGREFVNKLSSCLFKLTGIEHRISSPYHPQTNGLDERTNQTLTRALIKFSEAKENWDESIDAALYAYRIAKQDSSQFSPFFIMYNRNPRMAIDHEFSCKATTNVTGENTCTYDMEETLKSSDGSILKKAYNSFLLKEYLQPFEDGAQEINNDDDNDDIGDGDDCYCDDVGEDNGDIDYGSCSCGQVELMQKGQSGDRHCREALQYNEHLLHEQLYSPQLLRLLRSGADRLCYRAEEDEEFDWESLGLHNDEYALSKDTTVSVWIDFRKLYGEESLREVCNGDFVIVNEKHQTEFDKFKKKVLLHP
ncbi:hypothetical protein EMCRGX_G004896 [Ephydatia muelleri]